MTSEVWYVLGSLHLGSKNAHPGVQSGTGASAGKVCHLIHNQGMRCADSLEHTPPRLFYQALKNLSFNPPPANPLPPLTLTPFCYCQASPRLWSILLPPSLHLPLTPQLLELCIPPSSTPLTLLLEDHQGLPTHQVQWSYVALIPRGLVAFGNVDLLKILPDIAVTSHTICAQTVFKLLFIFLITLPLGDSVHVCDFGHHFFQGIPGLYIQHLISPELQTLL